MNFQEWASAKKLAKECEEAVKYLTQLSQRRLVQKPVLRRKNAFVIPSVPAHRVRVTSAASSGHRKVIDC